MEDIFVNQLEIEEDKPSIELQGSKEAWPQQIEKEVLDQAPFLYGYPLKVAITEKDEGNAIGQVEVQAEGTILHVPVVIKGRLMYPPDMFLHNGKFWPLQEQYVSFIADGSTELFDADPRASKNRHDNPFDLYNEAQDFMNEDDGASPHMGTTDHFGQKLASVFPHLVGKQQKSLRKIANRILKSAARVIPGLVDHLSKEGTAGVAGCLEQLETFADVPAAECVGIVKSANFKYSFGNHSYTVTTLADTGSDDLTYKVYNNLTKQAFLEKLYKVGCDRDNAKHILHKLAAPSDPDTDPEYTIGDTDKDAPEHVVIGKGEGVKGESVEGGKAYTLTRAVDGAPVKAVCFDKVMSMFHQSPVSDKMCIALSEEDQGQYSLQASVNGTPTDGTADSIMEEQSAIQPGNVYTFCFSDAGGSASASVPVEITNVSQMNGSTTYSVEDSHAGRSYTIRPHNANSFITEDSVVYVPSNFKVIKLTRKTTYAGDEHKKGPEADKLNEKMAFWYASSPDLNMTIVSNPLRSDINSGNITVNMDNLPKEACSQPELALRTVGVKLSPEDMKKIAHFPESYIISEKQNHSVSFSLDKQAFVDVCLGEEEIDDLMKAAAISPDINVSKALVHSGFLTGAGGQQLSQYRDAFNDVMNKLVTLLYASRVGLQPKVPGSLLKKAIKTMSSILSNM